MNAMDILVTIVKYSSENRELERFLSSLLDNPHVSITNFPPENLFESLALFSYVREDKKLDSLLTESYGETYTSVRDTAILNRNDVSLHEWIDVMTS